MRHLRIAAFVLFASTAALFAQSPSSTNNGDSCDVGVTPAATLLLPYFEVDIAAPVGAGATTLFTITNTSRYPQIAHITVWTDWAYPVLDFNVLLTGYDVHAINLFDVIVRGILLFPGVARTAPFENTANPNFATGELNVETTCAALRSTLPLELATAVRTALTNGVGHKGCSGPVGSNQGTRAHGYLTVDVVSYCTSRLPTDPGGAYFHGPSAPILFDNVLIGDYQQIGQKPNGFGFSTSPATYDAQGGPMVHIRAVPEGGMSGASGGQFVQTSLPFTFYDRYTPTGARTADRRQPLPSMWAARLIQGGTGQFTTDFTIWREGVTAGLPTCSINGSVQLNSAINITSLVRFDEHENSMGISPGPACTCAPTVIYLPAASRTGTTASVFPLFTTPDLGGWMFLNLSSGSQHVNIGGQVLDETLSAQRPGFGPNAPGTRGSRTTTQNWVTSSIYGVAGANHLSADITAAWLANGCTPAADRGPNFSFSSIRPAPLICPDNTASSNCGAGTKPPPVNP